jgi:hypothetical protein
MISYPANFAIELPDMEVYSESLLQMTEATMLWKVHHLMVGHDVVARCFGYLKISIMQYS